MKPLRLDIYDFDQTLYHSMSIDLADVEVPGFDPKWDLSILTKARRSLQDPMTLAVLLTGRQQTKEMKAAICRALRLADLDFAFVQLQPESWSGTTAQYKAATVYKWLAKNPSIKRVTFYDDLPSNQQAVGIVAKMMGKTYLGKLAVP